MLWYTARHPGRVIRGVSMAGAPVKSSNGKADAMKAMMNHKVVGLTEEEIFSLKDRLLCIVGKMDPFIMLGGEKLTEELGRYPLRVIFMDDAGHGINHEKAQEVDRLIVDYLYGRS